MHPRFARTPRPPYYAVIFTSLRKPGDEEGYEQAAARMLELTPFVDALAEAKVQGRATRPEWSALRWDIEELRVSLFAQELGFRSGVSPKKLAQRVAALR